MNLRELARGQSCIRCGADDGTTVGAHYTGVRRLAYGGGMSVKVNDLLTADLCGRCHLEMDQLSRDKEKRWEHSEEFHHLIFLTLLRRLKAGLLRIVK